MAAPRRAFAAGPAALHLVARRQLLAPRAPPASAAAATTPARTTQCWSHQGQRPSTATRARRWYSIGSSGGGGVSRIWTFDEVKELLETGGGTSSRSKSDVVIVDVREPHELRATGRIPGSVNVPMTTAAQGLSARGAEFREAYGVDRPPSGAHLLFYCRAGVRARTAAELARRAGWESVGEYTGSWLEWEERGGPVDTRDCGRGE